MMKRKLLALTFGAFAAVMTVGAAVVELSGSWRIAGEGLSGTIALPGTVGGAKMGRRLTEAEFLKSLDKPQRGALCAEYQYVGKAVYTRDFEVAAADAGREHELLLERVMWTSSVKLDGKPVGGEIDALGAPHVHPLGKLAAGRHRIELTVDNTVRYHFSRHSHAYGPSMQQVWNGVLGAIEVRTVSAVDRVKVFAGADGKLVLGNAAADVSAKVEELETAFAAREGNSLVLTFRTAPKLWSDVEPNLYTLVLSEGGRTRRIRFGFRTVEAGRHHVKVNGREVFLRTNVENANFAKDGLPWMTKGEWAAMFRLLKDEDGCNAFRFHSWCPPEAAFAAADEVGVYLQPECGIWSDGWMYPKPEFIGFGDPIDGFFRREFRAIGDAYGDHPSMLSLSAGNEMTPTNWKTAGAFVDEMKRADGRFLHFFCSARTILPEDEITLTHRLWELETTIRERLYPKTDWDYEADYSRTAKPTIAHEIGQWPVYPEFSKFFRDFTGELRPWNYAPLAEKAKAEGTDRFEREYHEASAALSRLIYKEEVESFLRTPSCAGLQLLSVQDYTGQGEALVGWRDPFYRLKSAYADYPAFNTIWGEKNYLARFGKFEWTVGETFRAKLLFRNLGLAAVPAGTEFRWSGGGRCGVLRNAAPIAAGALGEVGEIEVPLTAAMTAGKQTLSFGSNRWNFWVYPVEDRCAYPAGVVETADYAAARAALAGGKTVLFTGESRESGKIAFKPVYWSSGWFPAKNEITEQLGTWFDVKHPVFADFATDAAVDWQWYHLCEGARVHRLFGMPAGYRPFALSVNDFHFSHFAATMFEAKVGGGRLFVCGYDLGGTTPAAKRLRASVAKYLAGPCAAGTPALDLAWFDGMFAPRTEKAAEESKILFSKEIGWKGGEFSYAIPLSGRGSAGGVVEVEFEELPGYWGGSGVVDGHTFGVSGSTPVARVGYIREDLLDGKLEIAVRCVAGDGLSIRRIRVIED